MNTEVNTAHQAHSNESYNKLNDTESSSALVLILYCVAIVLIFYLLYHSYQQFLENRCSDGFVAGQQQERSDVVVDFDLQGEIRQLENMQRNILNNLSSNTGI
jgi:hypothetical protein